jgi:hypothetical protein
MSKQYIRVREAEFALRKILFPRGHTPRGKRSRVDADRQRLRAFFTDPNFLGFAVSEKRVKEKRLPDEFCLTFFVRRKLAESRLRSGTKIPKRLQLQTTESRVPTDVLELGQMHRAHGRIGPGSRIGHGAGTSETAGTLTFIARDNSSGLPLILSCSHVLAQAGNAQEGEAVESPPDPRGKPGPNVVGHLTDRFMVINPGVMNQIDAALAQPDDGVELTDTIPKIGQPSGVFDLTQLGPDDFMNLPVEKFGAETQLTKGKITGFPATLPIRFPVLGDRVAWFTNVATYDIEATEGDSGAVVVRTGTRDVVGMHIAGSGASCVFTPIQPVLDALLITL